MIGQTLAHYKILEKIGSGGMGQVYRARDTKLGREVAIKVLPEEFSRNRDRLERFEREAKLLAQLNHANIATLHGMEESNGQRSAAVCTKRSLADRRFSAKPSPTPSRGFSKKNRTSERCHRRLRTR